MLKGKTYHAVLFQDAMMYRAVGVFYKPELFHLKRKISTNKGVWLRLQHKPSQKHIWVGSAHLPNSEPREEISRFAEEFFRACEHDHEQAFAMGDFNIQFKWAESAGAVFPGEISNKWGDLRQVAMESGFQQAAPSVDQMNTATFHSRKGNVANTQIDGAFVSNTSTRLLHIECESRHEVSTDHDRVGVKGWIKGAAAVRVQVGGPRMVTGVLPDLRQVDHGALIDLARTHTKPASLGPKFRASAAVGTLRQMARHSKNAEDWKKYLGQLRREKAEWKGERRRKATEDWKVYRYFTKNRNAWGDEFMAKCDKDNPVQHVVDHFQGFFTMGGLKTSWARSQLPHSTSP